MNSSVGMKILLISNCPLDPNQGSGYVICGYVQRMQNRGHVIEAYGPDDVIWFPKMRRLKRLRLLLGYTFATLKQVLSKKFDLIELWGGPGWLAVVLLKWIPRRSFVVVARSNGLEPHYSCVTNSRRLFDSRKSMASVPDTAVELGFRKSNALTVVSRFDEEFAKARNYQPSDRILAIENPLEESWLGQQVNLEREHIVGFVGTWLTRKGSDLLPRVILDVLRRVPSSRFLIIGVGDAVRESIRKEFPDENKVEIIGSCSRDELRYHYSRMAVLLAPSIYESFGLVFAEGMACGAALVSTPVGFAAGLKDGIEFAKINNRNSEEIASTVCNLLTDEPRRKKIALAGYQKVQTLVWGDAVDRLETFYRQLLTKNSRA